VKTHGQQQSVFTCGNLGNLWFLRGHQSITQNKPNFKMGNINISTATVKAYAKEQRTMTNERHSKQTQSNPKLSPPGRNPALSDLW
jgi:3-deoxy-D-arabino-heptulosonate 7-phosphate (DAHP) synthase